MTGCCKPLELRFWLSILEDQTWTQWFLQTVKGCLNEVDFSQHVADLLSNPFLCLKARVGWITNNLSNRKSAQRNKLWEQERPNNKQRIQQWVKRKLRWYWWLTSMRLISFPASSKESAKLSMAARADADSKPGLTALPSAGPCPSSGFTFVWGFCRRYSCSIFYINHLFPTLQTLMLYIDLSWCACHYCLWILLSEIIPPELLACISSSQ